MKKALSLIPIFQVGKLLRFKWLAQCHTEINATRIWTQALRFHSCNTHSGAPWWEALGLQRKAVKLPVMRLPGRQTSEKIKSSAKWNRVNRIKHGNMQEEKGTLLSSELTTAGHTILTSSGTPSVLQQSNQRGEAACPRSQGQQAATPCFLHPRDIPESRAVIPWAEQNWVLSAAIDKDLQPQHIPS